jgi:putative ABC transport system ATP-binding protein
VENIDFARKAVPAAVRRRLVPAHELLERLGLGGLADRTMVGLSGGERQRIAFAATVSSGAGLLLADEPTSQLAHEDRDTMLELIHTVNREFGTTVVLVTHDPDVAAAMPRSITIRNGRIGSEGRHGFDFGVVDEDGAVHIPDDLATRFPAGTLVRFEPTEEGVLLRAVEEPGS